MPARIPRQSRSNSDDNHRKAARPIIALWITGSWTFGAQNWWGNWIRPDGKLTETIEAMQSIPPFVRKFSWD